MIEDQLTERIIGAAFKVHQKLGSGFLEKVYENALKIELTKIGLDVEQQIPLKVFYEGEIVGDYLADLIIEERVLIELKTVKTLTTEHEIQLVNYLMATKIEVGLLINFGTPSVQIKRRTKNKEIKKLINNKEFKSN